MHNAAAGSRGYFRCPETRERRESHRVFEGSAWLRSVFLQDAGYIIECYIYEKWSLSFVHCQLRVRTDEGRRENDDGQKNNKWMIAI